MGFNQLPVTGEKKFSDSAQNGILFVFSAVLNSRLSSAVERIEHDRILTYWQQKV